MDLDEYVVAERMLNEIHNVAVDDEYLMVPYRLDSLAQAKLVIKELEAKLNNIAEMCKVGLGD